MPGSQRPPGGEGCACGKTNKQPTGIGWGWRWSKICANISLVVWRSRRGGKSILKKLGVAGGRSLPPTTSKAFSPPRLGTDTPPSWGPGGPRSGADSRIPASELGSRGLEAPAGSAESGERPLGLGPKRTHGSHLRRGPRTPKQAQLSASATISAGHPGLLRSPGQNPGVTARACQTPSLRALPLLPGPSCRTVPKAGVARAWSTAAEGRASSPDLHYLPWPWGSSSSAGAARASQLRCDAGALGLFPLPPGPLSDHVTLLRSPCPNFRTPQSAAQSNSAVGSQGSVQGPAGWNPGPGPRRAASRRGARGTQSTARPQLPGAARLSLILSPALLLLLRAPLDRIGQQCGACHWPGEADGTLIGRARARGAPHSTVSERFETPKAPLSALGRGGEGRGRARDGVGKSGQGGALKIS